MVSDGIWIKNIISIASLSNLPQTFTTVYIKIQSCLHQMFSFTACEIKMVMCRENYFSSHI